MLEYFISTHGARKGLADTALRTADSGYLTRRLIDVAQEVTVSLEDCETEAGLWIENQEDAALVAPFGERCISRLAAAAVANPSTGEIIVDRNEVIDEEAVRRLLEAEVPGVLVRTPMSCLSPARRVPQLLRYLAGHLAAGNDRRSGGNHSCPEHRRAWHPAHDAHLPHRWHRGRRHHKRSTEGRGAVRGQVAEGGGSAVGDRRRRGGLGRR